jgi:hypothetical protein
MERQAALPGYYLRGSADLGEDIRGNYPAKKRAERRGPRATSGRAGLLPRGISPRRLAGSEAVFYALGVLAKLLIALASSSWTSKTV